MTDRIVRIDGELITILREAIKASITGEDEVEAVDIWTVPGPRGTTIIEMAIGNMVYFIPQERLTHLFELGKVEEWVKGVIKRYRRNEYDPVCFRRIEILCEVNRCLVAILKDLPLQWRGAAAEHVSQKMRERFGEIGNRSCGIVAYENRVLSEYIKGLIAPKKVKAAVLEGAEFHGR